MNKSIEQDLTRLYLMFVQASSCCLGGVTFLFWIDVFCMCLARSCVNIVIADRVGVRRTGTPSCKHRRTGI